MGVVAGVADGLSCGMSGKGGRPELAMAAAQRRSAVQKFISKDSEAQHCSLVS